MITRGEITRLNRQLKKYNLRFCPDCISVLPLTEAHWYFRISGRSRQRRPSDACCDCLRKLNAWKLREARERESQQRQQRREEQKRKLFQAILKGKSA